MHRSAAVLLALVLAACGNGGASPAAVTDPPEGGSAAASPAEHTGSPGATTSPDAGPTAGADSTEGTGVDGFTCDLPIVDPGSAPIANVLDVRVGRHEGYDRLVFEFAQGTPAFTLDRAAPPFTEDASGAPIQVEGESFLGIVMRGGTKQTDTGASSYDGPTEFDTGLPIVIHAVEAGDFERQSTWILGLADEACVRVLLLAEPPRLVIDVEH